MEDLEEDFDDLLSDEEDSLLESEVWGESEDMVEEDGVEVDVLGTGVVFSESERVDWGVSELLGSTEELESDDINQKMEREMLKIGFFSMQTALITKGVAPTERDK